MNFSENAAKRFNPVRGEYGEHAEKELKELLEHSFSNGYKVLTTRDWLKSKNIEWTSDLDAEFGDIQLIRESDGKLIHFDSKRSHEDGFYGCVSYTNSYPGHLENTKEKFREKDNAYYATFTPDCKSCRIIKANKLKGLVPDNGEYWKTNEVQPFTESYDPLSFVFGGY